MGLDVKITHGPLILSVGVCEQNGGQPLKFKDHEKMKLEVNVKEISLSPERFELEPLFPRDGVSIPSCISEVEWLSIWMVLGRGRVVEGLPLRRGGPELLEGGFMFCWRAFSE